MIACIVGIICAGIITVASLTIAYRRIRRHGWVMAVAIVIGALLIILSGRGAI